MDCVGLRGGLGFVFSFVRGCEWKTIGGCVPLNV